MYSADRNAEQWFYPSNIRLIDSDRPGDTNLHAASLADRTECKT